MREAYKIFSSVILNFPNTLLKWMIIISPNNYLYNEIPAGNQFHYKPKIFSKDCLKNSLNEANIFVHNCEELAYNRHSCRNILSKSIRQFEMNRKEHQKLKCVVCKRENIYILNKVEFTCKICGRVYLLKADLIRLYKPTQVIAYNLANDTKCSHSHKAFKQQYINLNSFLLRTCSLNLQQYF